MGDILKEIKPENKMIGLGPEGDVRPRVIRIIREVATLKTSHHRKVKRLAERLLEAVKTREYGHLRPMLEETIEAAKRGTSTRINMQRMLLAAHLAYDLLLNGGFGTPTLTEDGKFVRLTALIVEVATDSECHTAGRACRRYFKELKVQAATVLGSDSSYPYVQRGRRPRRRTEPDDVEEARRRRVEAARSYRPLDELLDKMGV
jgi:hypothetical protein